METKYQNGPEDEDLPKDDDSHKHDPDKYRESKRERREADADTTSNNYGTVGHIGGSDLDDSEYVDEDED